MPGDKTGCGCWCPSSHTTAARGTVGGGVGRCAPRPGEGRGVGTVGGRLWRGGNGGRGSRSVVRICDMKGRRGVGRGPPVCPYVFGMREHACAARGVERNHPPARPRHPCPTFPGGVPGCEPRAARPCSAAATPGVTNPCVASRSRPPTPRSGSGARGASLRLRSTIYPPPPGPRDYLESPHSRRLSLRRWSPPPPQVAPLRNRPPTTRTPRDGQPPRCEDGAQRTDRS